jgi:hypothetical protein
MFEPYKRAWKKLAERDPETPHTNESFKKVMTELPRVHRHLWDAMQQLYRMDRAGFEKFAEDKPYLYILAGAEAVKKKLNIDVPYGSKPQRNKAKYDPKKPKVVPAQTEPMPKVKPMSENEIIDLLNGLRKPDVPVAVAYALESK